MSSIVQDTMSSENLSQFGQPVSIVLVTQAQDWQSRQKIAYNSMLGLISKDFLSLDDWDFQINTYSKGSSVLTAPMLLIKKLTESNLKLQIKMYISPTLGQVGLYLQSVYGLDKVFVASADVLKNSDALDSISS